MSELTELEQEADREARHGHRELVERLEVERDEAKNQLDSARHSVEVLEARVAEFKGIALDWEEAAREESNRVAELESALARQIDLNASAVAIWADNATAIERTAWNDAIRAAAEKANSLIHVDDEPQYQNGLLDAAEAIRTLLRNEGGGDG